MASEIAQELGKLRKQNGGMLPAEVVVNAARVKSSPLHSCFEWDDSKAAEAHRLWQARQLIVSVLVKYDDTKIASPAYVSLRSDRAAGNGYRAMAEVLSDDHLRAQLLNDAKDDMQTFRRRYNRLVELAHVFEAMESVK